MYKFQTQPYVHQEQAWRESWHRDVGSTGKTRPKGER